MSRRQGRAASPLMRHVGRLGWPTGQAQGRSVRSRIRDLIQRLWIATVAQDVHERLKSRDLWGVSDIDLATPESAKKELESFRRAHLKTVEVRFTGNIHTQRASKHAAQRSSARDGEALTGLARTGRRNDQEIETCTSGA